MTNERPRRRRGTNHGIAAGDEVGKSEPEVAPQPAPDQNVVNLNSKLATNVANIVFRRAQQWNFPIVRFECHDCLATCHYIREWLQSGSQDIRPLIRIDDQALDLIAPRTKGVLLLFESAGTLDGNINAPISVLSLYIPGDKHVRYFWTLLSPAHLLAGLERRALIGPAEEIPYYDNPPGRSKAGDVLPSRHHMLFTFTAESFRAATTFPEAPDYRTASQISDVCPSIIEPATAHHRIEAENDLHDSTDGKDLSDDRYILELHPAERALASLVHACCAEYLLIKRRYFKAFSRETILHAEKVRRAVAHQQNQQRAATPITPATPAAAAADDDGDDNEDLPADTPNSTPRTTRSRASSAPGARPAIYHAARTRAAHTGAQNRALRVRTRHAHVRFVEAQSGWSFARAKKLVGGWEILGFLDEERVLAVLEGDDDDDDDGGSRGE